MEQKKVTRDFKVLTEQISPDNVAVMAELIAMRETKALIGYYGYYAEKAHKNLCRDIFGKHEPGYIFSDSYDFVQSVALFLCDHFGEYLDDVLYISKKGKPITIKIECYRIVTRMLARGHRTFCRCQCFEFTKEEPELVYEQPADEEQDYSHADEITASLNLTKNMGLALDYRISGMSYPEIAKQLSRAVSTVYEYFEKMRARYSAIYGLQRKSPMSYLCITFSKIFSNRKIAFLFDGYHVEKQTKNFFKVARKLASLECNLSTKEESESQPAGNPDKYNLSAKGGNSHAKIA